MLYPISLRTDKGLGGNALSARILVGIGYWDFVAKQESATDTADCRAYLEELATSSDVNSWYRTQITLPPGDGPFAIEILDANGDIVGDDLAWGSEAAAAGGAGATAGGVTREQFAIKVLSTLSSYDRSGMDPQDQQNVLDAYDCIYQELKDEGLVTWAQGEGELIPVRFLNSLVSLTAASNMLLGAYPQQGNSEQRLIVASQVADRRIRRQLASAQSTETTVTEYF